MKEDEQLITPELQAAIFSEWCNKNMPGSNTPFRKSNGKPKDYGDTITFTCPKREIPK